VTAPQQPPVNTSAPTITGIAQPGQTLSESHGSWTNQATSFGYQWLQCDGSGNNCSAISGATGQTYISAPGDVGRTIRVQETASNAGGSSTPASSAATATVLPPIPTNISPPTISGTAQQGQTLTEVHGSWTNEPTSFSYEWLRCDGEGSNCSPISGATSQTYVPVAGDVGRTLRVQETVSNAAGLSSPASSAATATVLPPIPTNISPPTISGTAQQGQTLTLSPGSWTESPTSYSYQWQRCDSTGANCAAISGAIASAYTLAGADVGATARVTVTASNAAGPSAPATSAQSAVVSASTGVSHLEYVFNEGLISVYDTDREFKLLKTISLPQTEAGIRGVMVAPSTHTLFISYGGDGPINGSGNGSVLAYDLLAEKVVWTVNLKTGIDSGAVSPDSTKLYVPTGENTTSGIWNVLSTANGEVIGTIQGGANAHNTIASSDGRYVYLGGRNHNYLDVYETASAKIKEVGPLVNGVRPFTVNGSNTLAFTTATEFDGFQASSITTGKVLFTVPFGAIPEGFPFTTASHGVSLSPDEKQLYVIDSVHKEIQVWDVSKVAEGAAPAQLGVIPVAGLAGNESLCAYDCGRGGWLQHSLDGRFVYVGDSGEVIETATRKVITTLSTLANTQNFLEIDWQNGVPIATSGRTGAGYVG
jgi:predicted actin-binding protein